jgi:hypothetical protein
MVKAEIPVIAERFCANSVAGYPIEASKELPSRPKVPPETAVLLSERGVADASASGRAEARVRGATKLLIGVVNEKNTNIRPASAGFAQLAPSPPNTHFATNIANTLARNGINRGIEGLIFNPTNKPVRNADPSQRVDSLYNLPSKNSDNKAVRTETPSTNRDLKPNTYTPQRVAGASASETLHIMDAVFVFAWRCGEEETVMVGLFIFSFSPISFQSSSYEPMEDVQDRHRNNTHTPCNPSTSSSLLPRIYH